MFIPDLYWDCHRLGLWSVAIDLLDEEPLPVALRESENLRRVSTELKHKFFSILAKHSAQLVSTVTEVKIFVEYPAFSTEELHRVKSENPNYFYSPEYYCKVCTKAESGQRYEVSFRR
jgi:hypothetical protein